VDGAINTDEGLDSIVCACEKPIPREYLEGCISKEYNKPVVNPGKNGGGKPPKPKDKCCVCGKSSKEKNIGCECIFCADCLSE